MNKPDLRIDTADNKAAVVIGPMMDVPQQENDVDDDNMDEKNKKATNILQDIRDPNLRSKNDSNKDGGGTTATLITTKNTADASVATKEKKNNSNATDTTTAGTAAAAAAVDRGFLHGHSWTRGLFGNYTNGNSQSILPSSLWPTTFGWNRQQQQEQPQQQAQQQPYASSSILNRANPKTNTATTNHEQQNGSPTTTVGPAAIGWNLLASNASHAPEVPAIQSSKENPEQQQTTAAAAAAAAGQQQPRPPLKKRPYNNTNGDQNTWTTASVDDKVSKATTNILPKKMRTEVFTPTVDNGTNSLPPIMSVAPLVTSPAATSHAAPPAPPTTTANETASPLRFSSHLLQAAQSAAQADRLVISVASEGVDEPFTRGGTWTTEEEAYAVRAMHEFKAGMLPLRQGTRLRTFLSKLLICKPKRVSDKFGSSHQVGNYGFSKRNADYNPPLTQEQIQRRLTEFYELEQRFLASLSLQGAQRQPPSKEEACPGFILKPSCVVHGGRVVGCNNTNKKVAFAAAPAVAPAAAPPYEMNALLPEETTTTIIRNVATKTIAAPSSTIDSDTSESKTTISSSQPSTTTTTTEAFGGIVVEAATTFPTPVSNAQKPKRKRKPRPSQPDHEEIKLATDHAFRELKGNYGGITIKQIIAMVQGRYEVPLNATTKTKIRSRLSDLINGNISATRGDDPAAVFESGSSTIDNRKHDTVENQCVLRETSSSNIAPLESNSCVSSGETKARQQPAIDPSSTVKKQPTEAKAECANVSMVVEGSVNYTGQVNAYQDEQNPKMPQGNTASAVTDSKEEAPLSWKVAVGDDPIGATTALDQSPDSSSHDITMDCNIKNDASHSPASDTSGGGGSTSSSNKTIIADDDVLMADKDDTGTMAEKKSPDPVVNEYNPPQNNETQAHNESDHPMDHHRDPTTAHEEENNTAKHRNPKGTAEQEDNDDNEAQPESPSKKPRLSNDNRSAATIQASQMNYKENGTQFISVTVEKTEATTSLGLQVRGEGGDDKVVVHHIEAGSPLADTQLKLGMGIYSINGVPVESAVQAASLTRGFKGSVTIVASHVKKVDSMAATESYSEAEVRESSTCEPPKDDEPSSIGRPKVDEPSVAGTCTAQNDTSKAKRRSKRLTEKGKLSLAPSPAPSCPGNKKRKRNSGTSNKKTTNGAKGNNCDERRALQVKHRKEIEALVSRQVSELEKLHIKKLDRKYILKKTALEKKEASLVEFESTLDKRDRQFLEDQKELAKLKEAAQQLLDTTERGRVQQGAIALDASATSLLSTIDDYLKPASTDNPSGSTPWAADQTSGHVNPSSFNNPTYLTTLATVTIANNPTELAPGAPQTKKLMLATSASPGVTNEKQVQSAPRPQTTTEIVKANKAMPSQGTATEEITATDLCTFRVIPKANDAIFGGKKYWGSGKFSYCKFTG